MKRFTHTISILCSIMLLALGMQSCKKELPEPAPQAMAHTVIVYMGAENSLNTFSKSDINEMMFAHKDIPKDCQIVIFKDDIGLPSISLLNNKGLTTWKEYKDEINSADASTMKKVLQGIISDFPSTRYSLILWSHGNGWYNRTRTISRSIIIDNGNNTHSDYGSWIHISDLAKILSSLPRMDYIFFDACYMQTVEVAAELYPYTDYIIGSPTEIPGNGAPYHLIMKDLCLSNPQGIIDGYASGYPGEYGVLLSAVSCADFPDFCAATTKYICKTFPKDNMPPNAGIQIYAPRYGLSHSTQNSMPVPFDMRSAMHRLLDQDDFATWNRQWQRTILYPVSAKKWDTIYPEFTYGNFHCTLTDAEHYGGISMNIPNPLYDSKGWNEMFRQSTWYTLAGWQGTGW